MKNLIIINGAMGCGKTTASKTLMKYLPRSVMLDGDWCWYMDPFRVTETTKTVVLDNIIYMLKNYMLCGEFENIIFCWVLNDESVIDRIKSEIERLGFDIYVFTLICGEAELERRLLKDVKSGARTDDVIKRALSYLRFYDNMDTEKIYADNLSAAETALYIADRVGYIV